MVTVKVSALAQKIQELLQDRIEYVDIEEIEADEELPKFLTFFGHASDGLALHDYEEIDHVDPSYFTGTH